MYTRPKRNTFSSTAAQGDPNAISDANKSPLHPLAFSEPVLRQGRRTNVNFVDPEKPTYQSGKALLACAHHNDEPERAYLPIKNKRIKTGLGHVDVCHVLTRAACDSNGTFKLTDEIVVVKVCKKRIIFVNTSDNARMEAAAMQLVGNDLRNVTRLLDILEDTSKKSLNLILPYYPGGSLQGLVSSKKYIPSEKVVRNYFRDVMEGLRQLHSKGMCHRDMSLENVMLDGDKKCVLIDLGVSLQMPSDNFGRRRSMKPQDRVGKLGYICPEIYRKEAFDGEKVDVWSAGSILYQMLTGVGSYGNPTESDRVYKIMTDSKLLSNQLEEWGVKKLSDQAMDLIQNMLEEDPSKRLTVEEVLKHPWSTTKNLND